VADADGGAQRLGGERVFQRADLAGGAPATTRPAI
jgi:hypothetical protein